MQQISDASKLFTSITKHIIILDLQSVILYGMDGTKYERNVYTNPDNGKFVLNLFKILFEFNQISGNVIIILSKILNLDELKSLFKQILADSEDDFELNLLNFLEVDKNFFKFDTPDSKRQQLIDILTKLKEVDFFQTNTNKLTYVTRGIGEDTEYTFNYYSQIFKKSITSIIDKIVNIIPVISPNINYSDFIMHNWDSINESLVVL